MPTSQPSRPGTRARNPGTGRARHTRWAVLLVVAAGAAGFALASQLDLGAGLLALAGFIGWAVALALPRDVTPPPRGGGEPRGTAADARGRRIRVAVLLGVLAITLGLAMSWALSRIQGGVLPPLEYLDQRYGPLAWLHVGVAAVLAGLRAR